ncbi:MAG: hypothetical protein DWI22_20470 [Planctomycetota bacterium]|nr:MAG: hypothetical protein DWI22_20470 [Planctomycetota bacterium]
MSDETSRIRYRAKWALSPQTITASRNRHNDDSLLGIPHAILKIHRHLWDEDEKMDKNIFPAANYA